MNEVTMEVSAADQNTLERLEEELWRENTRFNKQRMEELIASDFFEFGRSGRIYQRQQTLDAPSQALKAVLPLPKFHVRLLNENTAQTTYNSAVEYDDEVEYARRSSIWSRTESGWALRFHQGTPFYP